MSEDLERLLAASKYKDEQKDIYREAEKNNITVIRENRKTRKPELISIGTVKGQLERPKKPTGSRRRGTVSASTANLHSYVDLLKDKDQLEFEKENFSTVRQEQWKTYKDKIKLLSPEVLNEMLPSDYLHYYYNDYLYYEAGAPGFGELKMLFKTASAAQITEINKRTEHFYQGQLPNFMNKNFDNKTKNAIEFCSNIFGESVENVDKIFKQIYEEINDPDKKYLTSGGSKVHKNQSWLSLSKGSVSDFFEKVKDTTALLADAAKELSEVLAMIKEYFSKYAPTVLCELEKALIAQELVGGNMAGKNFKDNSIKYAEKTLTAKMKETKFGSVYELTKGNDGLTSAVTSYIRLTAQYNIYKNEDIFKEYLEKTYIDSDSETEKVNYQKMLGKSGGILNTAASGLCGEMGVDIGFLRGTAEILSKSCGKALLADVTGSGQIPKNAVTVLSNVDSDECKQMLRELESIKSFSKDDVILSVGKDKVAAVVGVTVKNTSAIDWNSEKPLTQSSAFIDLESNTPLDTVINQATRAAGSTLTKKHVINIMAAHTTETDFIDKDSNGFETKHYDPNKMFGYLLDLLIVYSFVDFISGSGLAGDNSTIMILNGKPFLVADVIRETMESLLSGSNVFKKGLLVGADENKENKPFTRETFTELNNLEGSDDSSYESGQKRSNKVWDQIRLFKLSVGLNLSAIQHLWGQHDKSRTSSMFAHINK